MLAVVWGAEHFHLYLTKHYINRHPCSNETSDRVEEYINYIAHNAVPKALSTDEICSTIESDPTYQAVSNAVKTNNWRSSLTAQYHKIKDFLRGTRLVIPTNLQQRAVHLAHAGHQGIVRTKRLLRDKVWFPGIDKLAEESVKKCLACQACTTAKHLEPMQNSRLPAEPWSEVSIDFPSGLPNNTYLLVIMDDYSKFPEVEIVNSTSAKAVLPKVDAVFARHVIPAILKSDNGPPFSSEDFCKYAQHSGFVHRKLTPLWPQANGEIEHFWDL
ncbi:uncharacterized protein LOC125043071 [Penaeus chinensis]|uniref:uncharacterized protein LOC125043071 n=1 Tax=Penaeus chinensis TaxID=139456 RepID=UPI001FB780D8|nr:uncharacterized protein LOC125043071 [Penaeus chinensis]